MLKVLLDSLLVHTSGIQMASYQFSQAALLSLLLMISHSIVWPLSVLLPLSIATVDRQSAEYWGWWTCLTQIRLGSSERHDKLIILTINMETAMMCIPSWQDCDNNLLGMGGGVLSQWMTLELSFKGVHKLKSDKEGTEGYSMQKGYSVQNVNRLCCREGRRTKFEGNWKKAGKAL